MSEGSTTINPPSGLMLKTIEDFWRSRSIYAAAKLGIADHLRNGTKTVDELATATGTYAPALYRLLRALSGVGVFHEDETGRFSNTPLGATLRSDVPGSVRAFITVELGEEHYPAWGDVLHSLRTGETAFSKVFGMPVWDFFSQHPENAKTFDDAMKDTSEVFEAAITAAYDFSPFGLTVDVGGGSGSFTASILKANSHLKGIVMDLPHVIEHARSHMHAEGLLGRCELVAGDFFDAVPAGGDGYLLKNILLDWDDEGCIRILKNCSRVMTGNAKLLVFGSVLPGRNQSFFGNFMDLNMLVMSGGRERSAAEYARLLEAAGLKLASIVPTQTEMSVLEAVRA